MLREQHILNTTHNNRQTKNIQKLQLEHQRRLQLYRDKLHELQEKNQELTRRHQLLLEKFDSQVQKIEGMREDFSHKLAEDHEGENSQLHALQENYEIERDARV